MVAKGCPRCGGDMFKERDGRIIDFACLQCGARASSFNRPIDLPRLTRRGKLAS